MPKIHATPSPPPKKGFVLWKRPQEKQHEALQRSYDMVKYLRKVGHYPSECPPAPPKLRWMDAIGGHDFSLPLSY
jgi:hypothetical protein